MSNWKDGRLYVAQIDLSEDEVVELCHFMGTAEVTTTALTLENTKLSPSSCAHLATLLSTSSTLSHLEICHDIIGREGIRHLSQGIRASTSLRTLVFCGLFIGFDGPYHLCQSISTNSHLLSVDISACDLGGGGTVHLARLLENNTTVTQWDISSTRVLAEGFRSVIDALRVNSTATTVSMGGNAADVDCARAMRNMLIENTCITSLDISNCQLEEAGGAEVSEGLRLNSSLMRLNMQRNGLGDGGVRAVCAALSGSGYASNITDLNISSNDVTVVGAQCVGNLIASNSTIMKLSIERYETDALLEIVPYLAHNKRMTTLAISNMIPSEQSIRILLKLFATPISITALEVVDYYLDDEVFPEFIAAFEKNFTVTEMKNFKFWTKNKSVQSVLERNCELQCDSYILK